MARLYIARGKYKFIGQFDDALEAAKAYDRYVTLTLTLPLTTLTLILTLNLTLTLTSM